ncbi:alpha/beta hydrolase [Amycolatopsis sp. YIM 10]|uniref:alpha/beta hydrolase n=1 Tax=Amycolatopsis sp. YIM 10 TaxID=2653857 RepID=UPI00128FFF40|nr:alpha/beta hydrolase [Amycolatopsis sp. YIM 10]QFU90200.1 Carboxylesterase NlhH [Amycolatopsis sp. YIM 10]
MRELDPGYSPSSAARDPDGSLRRYRARGDAARARLDVDEAVPYGTDPGERCHVFPGGPSALVFVHGGHWQESGIDDACFAASDAVAGGYTFVAVGYGLAPARTLPEMITSVARALSWLAESGARYGIDPERLHVAGSSAGAHLLAAALAIGDTPRVRGACLLSGLYDLTEIPRTYVNDALGLTPALARECSPLRMPAPACDSVLLAAGQHETPTYLRQHERYLAHLSAHEVPVTGRIVPGRDHFDLPLDLADPSTSLGRACLEQLRTTEGPVTSR